MGVRVDKVVRDDSKPNMKYEPNHPDANAAGYVAYPNFYSRHTRLKKD